MPAKKSAAQRLADHCASHPAPAPGPTLWICIPLLFWSALGFIWSIPVPEDIIDHAPWFSWSLPAIFLAMVFYVRLSVHLSVGLLAFMALCYASLALGDLFLPWPVGWLCLGVFILAGLGQWLSQRTNDKKFSLLLSPAWLMSIIYQKLGQPY